MTVGVVIATFGDPSWQKLADRAEESVRAQTVKADAIVKIHGKTLAQARNEGVARLGTEWGICLDADDLLTPEYIEKMLQAEGTLRYPMVGRIYPSGKRELIKYEPCDLLIRNYVIIGSMFKIEDFTAVGGFGEEPIFEDWNWVLKMWKHGVDIRPSQAIYVAYVRENSRNSGIDVDVDYWYRTIRSRYLSKP